MEIIIKYKYTVIAFFVYLLYYSNTQTIRYTYINHLFYTYIFKNDLVCIKKKKDSIKKNNELTTRKRVGKPVGVAITTLQSWSLFWMGLRLFGSGTN